MASPNDTIQIGVTIANTTATVSTPGNNVLNIGTPGIQGPPGEAAQTGALTGVFYPRYNNPSGFVMSSQTGDFVTTFQLQNSGTLLHNEINSLSGLSVQNTKTGHFASIFDVERSGVVLHNEINSLSGLSVRNTDTGNFVTIYQTGGFATAGNLVLTGDYLDRRLLGLSGQFNISGDRLESKINSLSGLYQTQITTALTAGFAVAFDNGTGVVTTGLKPYISIPYGGIITGWNLVSNISGSIIIDIFRTGFSSALPTHSIVGSIKPKLTNQIKNQDLSPTGWNRTVTQNDVFGFYLSGASGINNVSLTLLINKQ